MQKAPKNLGGSRKQRLRLFLMAATCQVVIVNMFANRRLTSDDIVGASEKASSTSFSPPLGWKNKNEQAERETIQNTRKIEYYSTWKFPFTYTLHGPETQASNSIQETTKEYVKNTFPIAFGIPTVQREGNPDYFRRTILSL
jgi:hypothetical protein